MPRAVSGTLFVVATPIGNLDDLTPRARAILCSVDRIAAEDTRRTGRLLTHIGAKTAQTAVHDFNEAAVVDGLVTRLVAGETVALVSDAGTPLVSDPGFKLVRAAHEAAIAVVPIPGASSLTAALSVAGIATDRFLFEGFLPAKRARRRERLEELSTAAHTLVFFEAVHRIEATLEDLVAAFGADREATLLRELTKIHEQIVHATLGELLAGVVNGQVPSKGEFVVVVAGSAAAPESAELADRLLSELAAVLPGKQATAIVARVTGEPKNRLYRRMLEYRTSGDEH